MAAMRGPRHQIGSGGWVAEERSCALQVVESEVEEFSYAARNDLDWLNEHMAVVFDENQATLAQRLKTPGKCRGKTPRTARKPPGSGARVPLSDIFSETPGSSTNRFTQKLNRMRSPMSQGNQAKSPSQVKAASRKQNVLSPKPAVPGAASQDSGYFGSQDIYDFPASQQTLPDSGPHGNLTPAPSKIASSHLANTELPRKSLQGAKDDQATRVLENTVTKAASPQHAVAAVGDDARDEACDATVPDREPSSPPLQPADQAPPPSDADGHHADSPARSDDGASDEVRSTSDGSSPIRGVVRKNSLNFASLPAREPLTAGKSMGARTSRLSHFDHNRKSYYNRDVGGKSSGNNGRQDASDEDADDMDVDDHIVAQSNDDKVTTALNHNKTYTQRLQAQINMLGKSNPRGSRPSKSIPNIATVQPNSGSLQPAEAPKSPTPKPFEAPKTTPGAFPEDDDDWIDPPPAPMPEEAQSPRPALSKSHSADVMEGIHKSDTVGDVDFGSPMDKRGGQSASPQRAPTTQGPSSAGLGHAKSVSVPGVPALTQQLKDQTHPLAKAVSVSNSSIAASGEPKTPSKSPSRGFRESPLKQVKNKLSSILKSSRDLISSSAAISAEGKTSILSPSTSRLALHAAPSSESAMSKPNHDAHKSNKEVQQVEEDDNKTLPIARRTRASVEREKEEKRIEKETKRLEKAREKEREKARVFSKEQERIAAMERQMTSKKGEEKLPAKETPKPTRTSPRKVQRLPESTTKPVDHDVEMADYPPTTQLPLAPRSAGPSQAARSKEIKRPVKPTRDAQVKAKQVPTVIRVHPGSQHPQYHSTVSSSTGSAPDAPVASTPQSQQQGASKAPLQNKQSTQSLKGASTAGRAKAAELAKKKEQEERDAQRRREAKAEMERKKAAAQEEQRKQDQRRQEADRQKQRDREQAAAHAEAKNAQRQAMIEKAKQTRAPPPAVRAQPNGPPDFSHLSHDKSTGHPARPPSRMEDSSRLVSTVLSNVPKPGAKRTMGPEASEEAQGKRQPSRGGLSYASKDAKRLRTTGDNDEMELDNPPNIKGPPVRPSAGFKKELPKKSHFQNAYPHKPSMSQDLFKAAVSTQMAGQLKTTHPLDMAQISKGAIPFAPNSNPAVPSYKTPGRPPTAVDAKSTAKAQKSSPRVQNGESIELPEIQTDDEDESDDEARGMFAAWADSPELRKALMTQESIDPSQIFGPSMPLNMEEVFNKSKERWHKYRARTSSANWSGSDRLTEDEIRKDLAARDKLRRDGAWSFELGREM